MSYIIQGETGDFELVIGLEVHAQVSSKAKLFSISPLEMKAVTSHNKIIKAIAINDVSLLRQSRQTAYLQIFNKVLS